MKKINKLIKISMFVFIISIMLVSSISATVIGFHQPTPTAQGYKELDKAYKSEKSAYGFVKLDTLIPDSVTFSARATNNSWGAGTTMYQTGIESAVNYTTEYNVGIEMQARFRNHNWSLNTGIVSGVFNYG